MQKGRLFAVFLECVFTKVNYMIHFVLYIDFAESSTVCTAIGTAPALTLLPFFGRKSLAKAL